MRYMKCWNQAAVLMIFCFSEDAVQKMIEQMEPPCNIDTQTNGKYASKQEHDLWLPNLKCF